MAMVNRYPGTCDKCHADVPVGEGLAIHLFGKNVPRVALRDGSGRNRRLGRKGADGMRHMWVVRCRSCYQGKAPEAPDNSEGNERSYASGYAYACGYHD